MLCPSLVWFVLFLNVSSDDNDLIVLNDDNFEHLTQAASGATTGDWLILMVKDPSRCPEKCPRIESELKKVAEEYRGRLNVAKIEAGNSRLTLRRFKISKKPVVMFFRLGYHWTYDGWMGASDLSNFVSEGYKRTNGRGVSKPLDRFDVWQEDFVKEMKAAYKERRLPEKNALLAAIAGVLVSLLLLACMCSSKKKEEHVPSKKTVNRSSRKKK